MQKPIEENKGMKLCKHQPSIKTEDILRIGVKETIEGFFHIVIIIPKEDPQIIEDLFTLGGVTKH